MPLLSVIIVGLCQLISASALDMEHVFVGVVGTSDHAFDVILILKVTVLCPDVHVVIHW